jgi:hypothetical protein
MKFSIFAVGIFLLFAGTMIEAKQSATVPMVPQKPLAIQIGKDWQVIVEAPELSDERGHVPFQIEQSVQPARAKPESPTENRKLKTPR